MSIRIPILHSTASCCNLPRTISMSVWWGDDAQSIYSFRGADIDNILYFTKVYPDTKVFKLEQNYRSTQTIVRAANSLIEKNQCRYARKCSRKRRRERPLVCTRHTVMWKRAIL